MKKRIAKNITALLTATALAFTLTACGSTNSAAGQETSGEEVTTDVTEKENDTAADTVGTKATASSVGKDVETGVPLTSSDITFVYGEQGYYLAPIILNQGWLEQVFGPNNIKVDFNVFNNGPEMIEAFTAGKLDFAPMGIQPGISGVANDAGVSVVAAFSDSPTAITIKTLKDSGIKTVADLKGKTVATTIGSSAYSLLVKALEDEGLSVDTDINFVNIDFSAAPTVLETGEVDASVGYASSFNQVALADGDIFYTIKDATGYGISANIYVARNDFAKEHPDVIENILVIEQWAIEFLRDHHDEAVKINADYFGVDEQVVEDTLKLYTYEYIDPEILKKDLKGYADFMYDSELISRQLTAEDIADFSYFEATGIK